ncbi:hypothetical protein LIER_30322 [Lithospermum erythrorhizon]|uniref:GAG-pre-integrase domain-containing protein n=1 Tax=Lithospermum erythrorhizon TaxID=34254 RepID=A0AAV3RT41_LITER
MGGKSLKVEKFTGRNSFSLWQIKVRALLKREGLWTPLVKPVPNLNLRIWYLSTRRHIQRCCYQWRMTSLLRFLNKTQLLDCGEGTSLKDLLDRLNSILLDLRNIEIKIDDEDAALILLASLPPSYENFRESMTNGKDFLFLEEVRSSLHSREILHTCSGPSSDNQVVGFIDNNNQSYGKPGKEKFSNKPFKKGPKLGDTCNYCKEKGQWKSDCPKKRQGQFGNASGTVAVAEDGSKSDEDIALVADGHTHYTDVWVIDSGTSYQICPRREWFLTYEQVDGGNISMANSSTCKVVRIGSIKLRTHDGMFCTLNDVRHVPHMTKNLISLSLLDKKGFSFKGECGVLHVYNGSKVILKGVKWGTSYFLQGATLRDSTAVASSEVDKKDMNKLWHMRLGHMSERGMQILAKDNLLGGHEVKDLGFCEHWEATSKQVP